MLKSKRVACDTFYFVSDWSVPAMDEISQMFEENDKIIELEMSSIVQKLREVTLDLLKRKKDLQEDILKIEEKKEQAEEDLERAIKKKRKLKNMVKLNKKVDFY